VRSATSSPPPSRATTHVTADAERLALLREPPGDSGWDMSACQSRAGPAKLPRGHGRRCWGRARCSGRTCPAGSRWTPSRTCGGRTSSPTTSSPVVVVATTGQLNETALAAAPPHHRTAGDLGSSSWWSAGSHHRPQCGRWMPAGPGMDVGHDPLSPVGTERDDQHLHEDFTKVVFVVESEVDVVSGDARSRGSDPAHASSFTWHEAAVVVLAPPGVLRRSRMTGRCCARRTPAVPSGSCGCKNRDEAQSGPSGTGSAGAGEERTCVRIAAGMCTARCCCR
jgi:hypothetical protein